MSQNMAISCKLCIQFAMLKDSKFARNYGFLHCKENWPKPFTGLPQNSLMSLSPSRWPACASGFISGFPPECYPWIWGVFILLLISILNWPRFKIYTIQYICWEVAAIDSVLSGFKLPCCYLYLFLNYKYLSLFCAWDIVLRSVISVLFRSV